ncbi:MAG: P-II family nitrogen regulator, partial [Clostridia bacterium]|nr:P-II family nitrogen regulator [Clostridia bacterium]
MKKIEAIIRPEKLNDLLEALNKHQFYGVTVSQVMGAGLQRGRTHFYRGNEIITNLHPKTKLEIVVKDSWVNEVIETIIEITKTGNVGD